MDKRNLYTNTPPGAGRKESRDENEFSRTKLLMGSQALARLNGSAVLIFGAGGVGSHCIEALARSGVGRLMVADPDRVSITNINRQSIALHSTVGRLKTHVIKERILDINPKAGVYTSDTFVLPDNLDAFFACIPWQPDYIIDAIDTVSAKLAIAAYAYSRQIPMISSMGTGNKLHPELFEIADIQNTSVCPLCRVMRRELKGLGVPHLTVLYSREKPRKPDISPKEDPKERPVPGSVSFVPPVAGLLIAGEVIRRLAGL